MFWIIPTLFAVCTAMLVYVLLIALREAEEAHVSEYTADTARQFEDLFLFIPPDQLRRLTHITALVVFLLLFMLAGLLAAPLSAQDPADPAPAGSAESMQVSGLDFSTTYYFAMKTSDEVPNESPPSGKARGTPASRKGRQA